MSESRGAVGWGDALTAATRLDLSTPEDLDALLDLLGLSSTDLIAVPSVPTRSTAPRPRPRLSSEQTAPPGVATADDAVERETVVEVLEPEPVDFTPGEAQALGRPSEGASSVPYEPPVPARLLRAALVGLVRRMRRSGEIDMEAATRAVAEQEPVVTLPDRSELSTHRGATVIADVSRAMLPYQADISCFVSELSKSVGAPNVDVHVVDEESSLDLENLGEAGRPVLVVSTLGAVRPLGEPAVTRWRWVQFAEAVEEAGADVVALVPHRLRAWPDAIARSIRIVTWDDLDRVGPRHD